MIRAKKAFGQHFLRSERALSKIIEVGNPNKKDVVLEIGPGEGVLTEKLLQSSGKVVAVEKDRDLCNFLKEKFAQDIGAGRLELICADILDFDPDKLKSCENLSYKIIANIPYNITGYILKKFLSAEYQPKIMVLLVQKEVARRIVGEEGGKESMISLSIKVYGEPRYVETVKAGSFVPRPKVDSAILAIEGISREFFEEIDEKKFFEMMKIGFGSKRKMLISNLGPKYGREKALEAFKQAGIDEKIRAEDLTTETWKKLAISLI